MVDTFSTGVLLVLGLVLYQNIARGTAGSWFKSKFFNAAAPGQSFWSKLAQHPTDAAGTAGGSSGSSVAGGGTDVEAFIPGLLAELGAPANASTTSFLRNWIAREGTGAQNNPLATTLRTSESHTYGTNSAGVQEYPTLQAGIDATARTLTGGGYSGIVADLRRGDGAAAGNEATELSRWSGGGYNHISVSASSSASTPASTGTVF